ncbi:MAG: MFS transporter [Chloroflexota bacterium]|nr:MFS transporter [Chloroflexota bacterium]
MSKTTTKATRPLGLQLQIGLAFLAFILIGANDGAVGVLLPSLQAFYRVDKATIALLFLAGTLGYLIAAFASGALVERLGLRRFLLLGVGGFLGSAALMTLRPPFFLVLVVLLLLGFGVAILDAGLNAYIAGLPDNTALLNYLHAFYGLGALTGPLVASGVLALGGVWNQVYAVWVAISLIVLAGVLAWVPRRAAGPAETHPEGAAWRVALRLRVVVLAAAFLLFYVGSEVSLGSWSYSLLTEERHEAALLSGWIVSGYWLGLTLGRLTLARLAARVGNRRLIEGCLIGVVIGVLLVWVAPGSLGAALGLWITGFSLGPIFPTTIALMAERVPSRLLPSAIGFLASAGSAGAALFPWIAGNLAERIGLWALLPYIIILTSAMLGLWWAIGRTPPPPSAPVTIGLSTD